jgi:hypothetical protein
VPALGAPVATRALGLLVCPAFLAAAVARFGGCVVACLGIVPMTAGSRYEKKDKPKPNSLPCIILCVFRLLVRAVSVLVLGRLPLLL